jgi:hypothetical protein
MPGRKLGGTHFAASIFAFVQMCAALWLFYPGLVTYDSILQFNEAITGRFTTNHPPLMAAVWRVLLHVGSGAWPMLVMNQLLYWASFAALAVYCVRNTGRKTSMVAVLAGLWPLLLSFSGVIWKDVTLAAAWGLSCALLLLACQHKERHAQFWSCWCGAAVLLIFGTGMRHNAAPAALVLALALCLALPMTRWVRAAVFVFLAVAAMVIVPLSGRLLQAQDSRPITFVISWDLTGISYFSGSNYRTDLSAGGTANLSCYSPRLFDNCPVESFASMPDALRLWRGAIEQQPLAYLEHRTLVFSMLLRFGCRKCRPYIAETGMSDLPPGLEYRGNPVRSALAYLLVGAGLTPVGRPYAWLTAAIGLTGLFWRRRPTAEWKVLSLICLSGVVYTLTYFPAAVTDEFRYVYWLIYSVVLGGTAYLFGTKVAFRDVTRWIILPVLCVICLDTAVQSVSPTDHIAPSMATNY